RSADAGAAAQLVDVAHNEERCLVGNRPQQRLHERDVDHGLVHDQEVAVEAVALVALEAASALSRCRAASAKCRHLRNCQAAATAVRHVVIAAARSARCVWAEMRWRWTLKVL